MIYQEQSQPGMEVGGDFNTAADSGKSSTSKEFAMVH